MESKQILINLIKEWVKTDNEIRKLKQEVNKRNELQNCNRGELDEEYHGHRKYFKRLINEKNVGQLGNECRFLAKLVNSFQNEVTINYFLKFKSNVLV